MAAAATGRGHRDQDKLEGWSCPSCTYVNLPLRPGCEQCSTARPDNYQTPRGYRPTREEEYITGGHHEAMVYMEQVIAAELDEKSHERMDVNIEKQSQVDSQVARELQAREWQAGDAESLLVPVNIANEEFNAQADDVENALLATVQVAPVLQQATPPQPVHPVRQEEPLASLDGLILSDRDFDETDYELLQRLGDQIGEAKAPGMPSQMIKRLPIRTFSTRTMGSVPGESEAPKCLICLEDFSHQDGLYVLPCGHEFHVDCTQTWLQNKAVCPVCSKEVNLAAPRQ